MYTFYLCSQSPRHPTHVHKFQGAKFAYDSKLIGYYAHANFAKHTLSHFIKYDDDNCLLNSRIMVT